MAKGRILLIDDDEDFVESTTITLENNGYEVISALDALNGFAKAREEKPDLILLDVMMSSTTEGFDTLSKLRDEPQTSEIPVIMLTAIGKHPRFKGTRFDTEQLPADMFLEKPVRSGELLSRIEKLLEK